MKRPLLIIAFSIVLVSVCSFSSAAPTSGNKKKSEQTKSAEPAKKRDSYTIFLKDVVSTCDGGFCKLYKTGKNKVFMEMPKSCMGRRFLIGGTVSSVSDPSTVLLGYRYASPVCVKMDLLDSVVVMTRDACGATSPDPLMQKAIDRNYMPQTYKRLSVRAQSKDSSAVIFDITSVLTAFQPKSKEIAVSKETDSKTSYFGDMKVFSDNASVMMYDNVDLSKTVLLFKVKTGECTVGTRVSFLMLPQKKMRPRIQDARVGVFSTGGANGNPKYEISDRRDGLKPYRLANRWRIEPSDTSAWIAGQMVTVSKPVVWYVDDSFPEFWKASIRKGILSWNAAFEAIGLKDVMQVRDFPSASEDPEFDPDNLKYTCIRYIPNATMNAMGPSWVDPDTGEILCASVFLYNDVIRLINNWRFVQTAQVDERVRASKMPADILDESLTYVVAHEVGHTLGLMHNMAASASIPVDSLRSPSFTRKYGTTSSIMDYARFNYVAQPQDKLVRLSPPSLGVYDLYAIEWLYKPVPDASDMWEEAKKASGIIDARRGDRMFRYGAQQVNETYDPSALSEDLGDDPLKAGDYGISNLKYILSKMDVWIGGDAGYRHLSQLYSQLVNQYARYIANVLYQVGGFHINNHWLGAGQETVDVISADVQKKSLRWALSQLKSSGWIDDRSLTEHFKIAVPASSLCCSKLASIISTTLPNHITLASTLCDTPYTLTEFYDDLYRELFASSLSGKQLSLEEKTLQREIVKALAKPAAKISPSSFSTEMFQVMEVPGSLREDFCGCADDVLLGSSQSPYQSKVDISSVDETAAYGAAFLRKVEKLSANLRNSAPYEDRAHYEYLYRASKTDSKE